MNHFDMEVFYTINHLAIYTPWLNPIMIFFAKFSPELYAGMFILTWFALPRSDGKARHALVVSVFAGIFALVINLIIAHLWFRSRPFAVLPPGSVDQLLAHSANSSFPSDHTAGSFGFAAAAWGNNRHWVSYPFTSLAILVMVARVYCGLHWPTDVIAGMVIGIIAGRSVWLLSRVIYPITTMGLRLFHYGPYHRLLTSTHHTQV
ncbi:phosphatase PAP2 family protein [Alicyclobacillaceae bacterium I2511]|nr:phosphatase PAP2 family protein [Alicyclobacillaceae bacterium I2511]